MIQRIQSLYIFAAIVLMSITSYLPILNIFDQAGEIFTAYASGIKQSDETILATTPLLLIIIAALASNLGALLLFNRRILQIRLIFFAILLQLGSYGMGVFYMFQLNKEMSINPSITITFPLIASIFSYLAIRAIGKDEALVKSIDRIR